jgi:chromosome segregation ATPase
VSLWVKAAIAAAVLAVIGGAYMRYTGLKHELEVKSLEYDNLKKEADVLRGVNKANEQTINKLEAERKEDRDAVERLTTAVGDVAAKADRTRTIIREIERNDPPTAALLDTPLTPGLRDALNRARD